MLKLAVHWSDKQSAVIPGGVTCPAFGTEAREGSLALVCHSRESGNPEINPGSRVFARDDKQIHGRQTVF